jgi:hypothetical protein
MAWLDDVQVGIILTVETQNWNLLSQNTYADIIMFGLFNDSETTVMIMPSKMESVHELRFSIGAERRYSGIRQANTRGIQRFPDWIDN